MLFSVITLVVALFVLIKGADAFIDAAKQVGLSFGMSAFAVGILIVGFGTSLPEIASSLAATLNGSTELVAANVVGSNITNILLIVGTMALLAGRVLIDQDILKTELPLFVISQVIMLATILDGRVDRIEGFFLLAILGAYIWYVFVESKRESTNDTTPRPKLTWQTLIILVLGLTAVLLGAHYTVESAVTLATALAVPLGLISITAIAIGTSLPELVVTIQSIRQRNTEMAIGNIYGSNTFNALAVLGVPALLVPLTVDAVVLDLGVWYMIAASMMFFVIGLSRQVMRWEGLMMVIFFVFFLTKLVAFL